jgi:Mg/Co/Ni transporter MgtE
MPQSTVILRWAIRLAFLAGLLLGIVLWLGQGYSLLHLHMWLGFIVAFALLVIVILSLLARVKPVLPIIGLLWAVALPVIGIAQLHMMPGGDHWVIQVIHLILGLGAIGLGEALSKRTLLRLRNQ